MIREILIVAGETSGDEHASGLVREINQLDPNLSFFGIGGERLAEEGVSVVEHIDTMAIMGFTEVVSRYSHLRRVYNRLLREVEIRKPARAILVDYPGFNLKLAQALRKLGVPIIYFISPQLWAWREKRVEIIRECVDQMICIFPFEEAWYNERGVNANFIGHPFMDREPPTCSRGEFAARHGIEKDETIVCLMPGSRQQEVDRHMPAMVQAVGKIREHRPDVKAIIAKSELVTIVSPLAEGIMVEDEEPILSLVHADVAVVASGTATVEAALYGIPSVVIYRLSPLSWMIARKVAKTPFIAMPNLIAGREVLPELLQGDATAERISYQMRELLDSAENRQAMKEGLKEVRQKMGRPGALGRGARLIVDRMEA